MIRKTLRAFTIMEMMVSAALISMIFSVLVAGSIYVQRSLNAAQLYAQRQAQQLQVSDYLARDLRNAKSVVATAAAVTIQVPDCYDSTGDLRAPAFDGNGGITYGASLRTIVYNYNSQNNTVSRTSDLTHDEPSLILAEDVEAFDVRIDDDRTVDMQIIFLPKFAYDSEVSERNGTIAVSNTMRRNQDPD